MLCGLLQPSDGNAWVDGFDIMHQPQKVKSRIGYMSQKFSLYNDLRVRDNIEFFAGIYGLAPAKVDAALDKAAQTGLENFMHRITRDLPLGWKQRLALYCAVMHKPSILFLDEPTAGVDPVSRRQFWQMIYELAANGTTVFVTTHFMDEAEYCQRLSIMHHGKVKALGSPMQLKKDHSADSIQDVFVRLIAGDPD
jgi:ABC-2 type transport system ATP-binding protein